MLLWGARPESGDLDDLVVSAVDMNQFETPAYNPGAPEEPPNLTRTGVCGNIKILGPLTKEKVSNSASHDIRFKSASGQFLNDVNSIRIDPV
jgi:hypothetical protein